MSKVYEELKLHICIFGRLMGLILLCVLLSACQNDTTSTYYEPAQAANTEDSFVLTYAGTYDSVDGHAIVISVNKDAGTITFFNRVIKRKYTLEFDGTSKFFDKYGSSIVSEQVSPGDVVDITFLKNKKLLNSLQKSADIWTYSDVKEYTMDLVNGNLKMMDGDYRFKEDVLVFADGVQAELMDINDVDSLKVTGYDHNIYAIIIEGSHGYLRLKGQDYFVGGWIEVGTGIIKNVSEDMLLTVPVGTYDVTLTKGELKETRTISIEKSVESVLDLSDLIQPEEDTKCGDIIFVTSPENADVFIDGQEADISKPVEVEYGIHQLIVRSEGYDTVTQYIKVGQEHATLEISLEKTKAADSNNSVSPGVEPQVTTFVTPAAMTTETSSYRVKLEAPEGAEVYLDGSYIGIVPVDFAKNPGNHVITLRKEGYETRSYTVTLDSLLQNESFSFALLKKNEEEKNEEEKADQNEDENED